MDERRVYFVNAPVDAFFLGGLSLLSAPLFLWMARAEIPWDVATTVAALGWVVNWPHFAATSYRLYRSRFNMAQYPATSFGVPLLVLAGLACALAWPLTAGVAFIKLFMLWSPFHFAGQTFGLTLLYLRRAGAVVGRLDRALIAAFVYSSYVWLVLTQESTTVGRLPRFLVPEPLVTAALVAMHVFGLAALLRYLRMSKTVPPIVLLPAGAQYVWFVVGSGVESFNLFVPFFHSLQYLLIAWAVQLKERKDEAGARSLGRESAAWFAINVGIGGLLFWGLPRALPLPIEFTGPMIAAAVQIHHFFVDGVIWKLRNPKVDGPLRVTWEELARP